VFFGALALAGAIILHALGAGAAAGAEALHLTWNDCAAGAGVSNRAFACNDEGMVHELIAAFRAPQPIDSVLGAELVIDLQSGSTTLPSWWRFDVGGCRAGNVLQADVDFGSRSACTDLWQGDAVWSVSYTPGMPHGGLNQARIRIALGTFTDRAVNANDAYYVARIVIESAGSDTCAGCDIPVCLVLNGILIRRPPRPKGAPSADVLLTVPASNHGNWATWQVSSEQDCAAVPVRRRTWGQVKALYR
jgi:hypothetical protein